MASGIAAAPPLSDLSRELEELRRQLASASDAQVASEVSQHHQTVLSNIMLTGQQSGQVAPEESLEGAASGVAEAGAIDPVSSSRNGEEHNTSADAQTTQPVSTLDQISSASDLANHRSLNPLDGQTFMPDVHLAQSFQLAATSQSQTEQLSRGESQAPAISIDGNDAPVAVVPIANQTTNEDAGFSFTVPTTSFTDVDVGDTLTLSATLADGNPLPAWLSFDPATQTFSGTPLNDDVGALTIRVTATDSAGASATQDFTVTVANTNDGPVASALIADQSTNEDASFSFTVAPDSFSDVDVGDILALTAALADGSPLPAWLSFDPATSTFSGTPLNDDVGSLAVRVTTTDSAGASASQDFTVTINNTNDGPVASAVIVNQATNEDAGFSFTVPANSFSDVDVGDTLVLTAALADGSPLPAWLRFDPATQTFSGTPLNDDVGSLAIRVMATDTSGATATQDFTVTVANTNDDPVASATIASQSINEDAGFSFTVPAASFSDVDVGDTLTLSATLADGGPLPAWLSFDPATQTFSGTPLNDDVGALTIRVTATDSAGASASQDFAVTVTNTNDGPVASATIANQSTNEDAGFSFTVPVASFSDVDVGDTLTLSATLADGSPLPAWLSFDAATSTFSGTPRNDDVGSLAIRIAATDTSGATATQDFTVTVNNTNDAPVITSSNVASFAENASGTVYTAAATDVDAGSTLTYSISGTDAALFNINATTGAVTFKSSPNYEAPTDVGANNVYDVTIGASDGTVTTSKDVTITVTNVNEAPTIASGGAANFAENGSGAVYTAAATDPDAGSTLTYSISGADAGLFNINATTGAVTFKSAPNFETPADGGGNNVYDVTVRASDGTNVTTKDVAITVTNVNEAPVITSAATASFAENGTGTVYTVAATDVDAGTTLTYSLAGTDAAKFNINATTGAVTFKSSPNYEAPTDSGANNVYNVTVRASDGALTTSKAVAITVTNANEAPTITSGAAANFAENGAGTVYTAAATDPDAGTTLTYSISGADAALFNINSTTGAVTFKSAPNYETPTDAGGNNVYNLDVTASDGTNGATKAVAVTVTNVNEAPNITSAATANFAENGTGTVYTAATTDPDAGTTLTYSISGADAALFNIDPTTGAITFKSSPNYEAPTDAGANNVYDVTVNASDGILTASKAVAITVANVNEGPVASAAITSQSTNEDAGFSFTVPPASFTDVDVGDSLALSATLADGSPLPAWLSFDPATQTFSGTPLNGDVGSLTIRVTATDTAGASATQDFSVTVSNTNDGPVASVVIADQSTNEDAGFSFTIPPASFTDVDVGDSLALSATLADGSPLPAWLSFDPATQTFSGTPLNGDVGSLAIRVTATDSAGASASQDFTVTISNTNDAPVITSSATANFAENGAGTVYTAAATDPDAGTTLSYSISGADAALFNIDATTGAITFKSAPNYEAPADAGDNNVYDVTVGASDGTVTTSKDVTITVTNVNEAPTITSSAATSFAENGAGTVYTAAATDPDAGATPTYSISGTDAALFNINSVTGAITFKSSPNYEAPADAGSNNVYDVNVTASDGTNSATKAVAITVSNVNDAPVITSGATASFAENGTGTVYTASATDADAGTTLTYSITGADAALFDIDSATGAVTFKSTPNYEAPTDVGANNVYNITVGASDGTVATSKAIAFTVTNVSEAPTGITVTGPMSVQETVTSGGTIGTAYNPGLAQPVVATLSAIDQDAGDSVTYSLVGAPAGLFTISGNQIRVASGASFDYETTPSYALTVRATDSTGQTFDQVVNINIANYAGSYTGNNGNNTATGTSEEDTISGGGGNDTLNAGDGNDLLNGGTGSDTLNGGAGLDTVTYATATAGVALSFSATDGNGIGGQYTNRAAGGYGGEANGDSFSGIEAFTGSNFADVIGGGSTDMTFSLGGGNDIFDTNAAYTVADTVYGGDGNDTMWTGAGNDSLYGGAGNDYLNGEAGTDTAFYSDATSGVTVNLATTSAQNTGGAGTDTLISVENLNGSGFADTLTGNSGDNTIWGGAGNDTLSGGAGNDALYGGAGSNTLNGGTGADLFFAQAGLGNDTVIGGAAGSWIDAIDLHDASGNSYSGAFPNDWTLVLTSGSITSTGSETLTLSTDSSGYVQHTDGTQVNFTEIEQIRW